MKTLPLLFALLAPLAQAQQNKANYDESKVGEVTLPDVLATGSARVSTIEQWTQVRRPQVLKLFQDHVYGTVPAKPDDLHFEVKSTRTDALGGAATRKLIHISLKQHPQWKGMDVMLVVPNQRKGKTPVFVGLSFNGNHAVSTETDIPISTRWMRPNSKNPKAVIDNRATEEARGVEASRWPLDMIVKHGFAVATAYYGDIEPDHAEGWKEGVRAALSEKGADATWKGGEWGAISAWSWGLSRILDYLETDPDVNASQAAVIGHSRLGKTSLWAGASDPRFGIVISNDSGEGGAALMRRNIGETTEIITRAFPHWFTPRYRDYASDVNACPVDQHMLIALMAPRPVYVASAAEDNWADQKGEFLSCLNAEPVYTLFGKKGLGVKEPPAIDQPVGDAIGYHNRTGIHDVTDYDWQQYLKFASRHFGTTKAP